MTDRVHTCQWPIGDPLTDDFRFCGAPLESDGKPYCAEHMARAYATADDREADRQAWLAVQRQGRAA